MLDLCLKQLREQSFCQQAAHLEPVQAPHTVQIDWQGSCACGEFEAWLNPDPVVTSTQDDP